MRTDLSRIVVVAFRQHRCKINHNRTSSSPFTLRLATVLLRHYNNNTLRRIHVLFLIFFPIELHANGYAKKEKY